MTAIRRLPDGELEVMQALWDCPVPASRGEIEEHFQKRFQRRPAMTTLLTHLTRLGEKGFVRIEKEGRQNRYTPLVSRESYLVRQGQYFVQDVCQGNMGILAAALSAGGLTQKDLMELRRLLEEGEL